MAIIQFYEYIFSGELDLNMNICFVFMDLAKTFGTVNYKILLYKIHQYEIRGLAYDIIKSYLQNEKQQVQVKSLSSYTFGINIGVPQGSAREPIFFLIYLND